ncbi:MAG: hypothetical protein IH898_11835 [Planctomycetes bacterium]|nr:hypothetical protein [Planctomycetota bacterium]
MTEPHHEHGVEHEPHLQSSNFESDPSEARADQVLNRERRAEVPWLANLPLISFFFKQEGISDESFSLMVLVRAHITDVHDLAMGK